MSKSSLEKDFELWLASLRCERRWEREYRFAAIVAGGIGSGVRKRLANVGLQDWRFDFAFPEYLVAVEIDGGTFSGGRHTRGTGYEDDCRKGNAAVLYGWRVLHFTGAMIKSGEAIRILEKLLCNLGSEK